MSGGQDGFSPPRKDEGGWKTQNYSKKQKSDNQNNNRNARSQLPPNYKPMKRQQYNDVQSSRAKPKTVINSQNIENEEMDSEQHDVRRQNRSGPHKLGFMALKELSMKEPMSVLQTISNSHFGFDDLLSSTISPDFMVLIMKIICKACSTEFSEFKKRILILACGEIFLNELEKCLTSLPLDSSEKNKARIKPFCENIIVFCQVVIEMMPNVAIERIRRLLVVTEMNLKACVEYVKITVDETFFEKLKQLISDLNELSAKKEEKENDLKKTEKYMPVLSENFRDIIIYPQPNDIHLKRPFLRKNLETGTFQSVELYLDTQFRLLREDFISPLRNGINEYMGKEIEQKSKKHKIKFDSVRVYNKVRFLKPKTTLNKVCYEVCFDVDNKMKNVMWERTKKFMFGSLLLFSNNHFHNFFLGVVANRELKELQHKRISVDLVFTEDANISAYDLMKQDFIMVESEVYFEPYYNVLNALKNLNSRNFPFEKYIVHAKCIPSPPKYIQNNMDIYKINVTNPVNSMPQSFTFHLLGHDWPSAEKLYLDESQYTAFKTALTNEFVVIQGPPGTGKTYLGLRIAEALLTNKPIWNYPASPILVVCYTNHALDQFLEGILNLTQNIIRIGGQSKNQNLAPFNLRDRRISAMNSNMQSPLVRDLRKKLSSMFYTIKTIQGKVEILDKNHGIISLKTLQCIFSPAFLTGNFNNQDEYLMEWLLEGITEGIRSKQNVKLVNCGNTENVVISQDDIKPLMNEEDFENSERMKNVFLDVMHFEEVIPNPGEVEVYYACTKNNIQEKLSEFSSQLEYLPSQNMSRSDMHSMMRITKQTIDDLKTICNHLETNLKLGIDNVSKDLIDSLEKRKDIWKLPPEQRWILYHLWIEKLKQQFMLEMAKCEERHRKDAMQYEEAKQMEDLNIIKGADVVGITTSTAAKMQGALGQLAPKIVIAEEAAEVLEAHIIASLTSRCEHLILIGDHKQLRPKPAEHKLAKEFHLDVSLFERMINNGMSTNLLSTQHRMRPEVSRLLVPNIYSSLRDHASVLNRKKIRGMEKSVFFLNHNHFEAEVDELKTKKNLFESRMLVALARHLILQGYKAEEITILTPYIGQMFEIKNEWNKYGLAPGLRITVVDNFQGEENRIILLSLVRSNKDAKIGFLKIDNRVCVALSRARDGLYIVGNMDNLVASSLIWPKIKQSLIDQEAYGPALVLRCEIHPKQLTRITCDKDFEQVIEGGCNQLCMEPLPCGHLCKSLCHVTNSNHALNKCSEPCTKLCIEGHPCKKRCFEACGSCPEPMVRRLQCDHEVIIACSIKVESYLCKREIRVRFKSCGHTGIVKCANKSSASCPEPCPFRLDCGHACERTCHMNDDPDHLKYFCAKPCSRRPVGCTTESHECKRACFEECEDCVLQVLKTLPCGHKQMAKCNQSVICNAMCKRTLDCGHKCKKQCKQTCEPCNIVVKKFISECEHEMKMYCYLPAISVHCTGKCNKVMTCGHRCKLECRDMCSSAFCNEPVLLQLNLPCGHRTAALPCNKRDTSLTAGLSRDEMLQYCNEPCGEFLDCGHVCAGTCGQCMQGRIHTVCDKPCGNVLICSHSCPVPCRQVCPPCNKPCPFSCSHSKCPKKCGELCIPCKEPCSNVCPHYKCKRKCGEMCNRPPCKHPCPKVFSCGHACVGFCGEPCPPCKPCTPEEYEEFFFCGDETEDDARYVLLEDCKHALEVNGLEQWLNVEPENNEIVLKVCPKCKTPITKVRRFQNVIKRVLNDVKNVKVKGYGKVEDIRVQRNQLLEKLQKSSFSMSGFTGYSPDADQLLQLRKLLVKDLQVIKNQRRNEFDTQKTMLYSFMTDYILVIENRLSKDWTKLDDPSKMELFNLVGFLISLLLKRDKKICKQEVNAFILELNRLHRWIDLFLIQSSELYKHNQVPIVKDKFNDVKSEISALRLYSDALDGRMEVLLKELEELANINIVSSEERKMIHQAMAKNFYGGASSQGHWFKCPNGHIYCITECGGAMQEAKCPVKGCNAMIGGQNHMYRSDARLASEMDGATHAAWSTGNDMRNFQL